MSQLLAPGSQFGGYRIIERVGRGGMATVYKAHQADLARYVAIKVLPDFLAADGDFRERFQHEAIAIANLRHPNIPAVYHYGHEGETAFIVTEFIDGGTLADQTGEPLPLPYTIDMLLAVASAVDYAHSRGVLHRDIKPPNVLMTRDGRPVLNDFGLARMMESEQRITQGAQIMGTPQYMAPEQCLGEELGPPADIYALSVVAYEMLTGRVPFTAATPAAVIMAQVSQPLPPPRSVNPALSPEVELVLLKGLAKDPGERYATASAMVQALAHARDATPGSSIGVTPTVAAAAARGGGSRGAASAATVGAPPSMTGDGSRNRFLAIGGAAALIVLAAAATWYFAFRSPSKPSAPVVAAATFGSAWTVGSPAPQKAEVPHGAPIWHAALAGPGSDFATPNLFGNSVSKVLIKEAPGYVDVAIKDANARARAMSSMPPRPGYIAEIQMAIRPGSKMTIRWITRTTDAGDHAMVMRSDAQILEYGYYLKTGGAAEVANNAPNPDLFTGKPFTLTMDITPDDSFSVFLNGEQLGNYNGGHPSTTGTMGLEAFGTGEFRVLSMAAYERT
jgi:serine/threonine-protein kinase